MISISIQINWNDKQQSKIAFRTYKISKRYAANLSIWPSGQTSSKLSCNCCRDMSPSGYCSRNTECRWTISFSERFVWWEISLICSLVNSVDGQFIFDLRLPMISKQLKEEKKNDREREREKQENASYTFLDSITQLTSFKCWQNTQMWDCSRIKGARHAFMIIIITTRMEKTLLLKINEEQISKIVHRNSNRHKFKGHSNNFSFFFRIHICSCGSKFSTCWQSQYRINNIIDITVWI